MGTGTGVEVKLVEFKEKVVSMLVLLPLVLLPVLFGGSHPAFWAPVVALFALGCVVAAFTGLPEKGPRLSFPLVLFIFFFLALPFLQVLPLPSGLLAVLSARRFDWLQQAEMVTHGLKPFRTLSYVPLATFFHGLLWLFFAGFAYLFAHFMQRRDWEWSFYRVLFGLALLEASYGILQVLIPALGVLWDQSGAYSGVARGTFINRNHFAAFMGLLWPLLLARVLTMRQRPDRVRRGESRQSVEREVGQRRIFFGFVVGLVILALVFSQSRAGISSAFLGFTVFVFFAGIKNRRLVAAILACWLVMFAYGAIIGFDQIIMRFDRLSNESSSRMVIYQETWHLVRDHFLTGSGLGSYKDVFQLYQAHLPENMYTRHAHNDYLEMAAELGFPAALALALVVWGFWWRQCLRFLRMRAQLSAERRLSVAGALVASMTILLHCWVDFNIQMAANFLYLVVAFMLLHHYLAQARPVRKHASRRSAARA